MRARLLLTVVALLAIVLVATGAITTVALHRSLVGQVDRQLTASQARAGLPPAGERPFEPPDDDQPGDDQPGDDQPSSGTQPSSGIQPSTGTQPDNGAQNGGTPRPRPPRPPRGGPPPPPPPYAWTDVGPAINGQPPDIVAALVHNGVVTLSGHRDPDSRTEILEVAASAHAALASVPADGAAHTRDLATLGSYRLAARIDDGYTVVIGLPLDPTNDTIRDLLIVESALALAALLLAGGAGALIVRRELRPLERVAATAAEVTALPLHQGEVALPMRVPAEDTDPTTEVGRVGAALNRLLTHVSDALAARQASETRVRQFVADASHELRTPLAAIRGYAELTRRNPGPVPADVAHAIRRVESESARMTSLVEDLLLLARLDAGRPLADGAVDLTAMVVDAVGDAHVAGPGHHWRLDLPTEAIVVAGDGPRLHQVLANLLANARTHTPPGTTVVTGLEARNDTAVLTVTDDGPGIPAELQGEIFDRFARGDSSRSRAAGSTGLGLAIVAAVVGAHRGEVTVASEPGRTAFTVRLPLFDQSDKTDG
ncbi:sensor histidine kinase [Asanoa ishikariensis]|uniref:histidine kinase n=1 Tax=Asanoa ishikariensis TaxID=137265 RepID=A0A1H3TV37_9ACTN|nr:ATP-binding protein [Asanoa ishikariensis]GIF67555.1 sensor histidine kinase [Asanoa ishikariensis]SDZ54104.1 two-component system, OmpR family, sensor kinase [Asanoa ishikariensis]